MSLQRVYHYWCESTFNISSWHVHVYLLLYCLYFSLSTILLDDHQQCLGLPLPHILCQLLSAVILFHLSHSGMVVSLYGFALHFLLACFLDILLPYVDVLCLFLSSKSRSLYSGSFLEMLSFRPHLSPVISHFCFNKIQWFDQSCQMQSLFYIWVVLLIKHNLA